MGPGDDEDEHLLDAFGRKGDPQCAHLIGEGRRIAGQSRFHPSYHDMGRQQERDQKAQTELRRLASAHAQRSSSVKCS